MLFVIRTAQTRYIQLLVLRCNRLVHLTKDNEMREKPELSKYAEKRKCFDNVYLFV